MSPPYIPNQDEAFRTWLNNFSTLITANPPTYGLTPGDAVVIAAQASAYDAALTLALDPSTRTAPTVADKDAKRAAALGIVRTYAINVRNNLGVTNLDKSALGLTLIDPSRTPVSAPDSNPLLDIIGATPGVHTLRYADSNTPASRKKPEGAIGMQLFRSIGDAPITDPATATFYGNVTRQPFGVLFDNVDNGKICTYFGRWFTRTGLVGPWSPPVNMTIAS